MKLEIRDIVSLNDKNDYMVSGKTMLDNKVFYLLICEKEPSNVKFCYEGEKENSLKESKDIELNRKLLPLFVEAMKEAL